MNQKQPLCVALAQINIYDTWDTDWRQADEITLRGLLMTAGDTKSLLLVMDYAEIWPQLADEIAQQIAVRYPMLQPEQIAVFTTQNHCVASNASGNRFNLPLLIEKIATLLEQLLTELQPAELCYSEVETTALIYNRRLTLSGVGTFTSWFGHDKCEQGIGISSILQQCFAGFMQGNINQFRCLPVEKGAVIENCCLPSEQLDAAEDQLIQSLFFRTLAGKPLGSIIRVPAHPAMTNRQDRDYVSADYPCYLRQYLEENFGGTSLFFTGPCGDQVGYIGEKSLAAAKTYGQQLGSCIIKQLPACQWLRGGALWSSLLTVELPLRRESRLSEAELQKQQYETLNSFNQLLGEAHNYAQHELLKQLKELSDQHEVATRILNNEAFTQQGYSIINSQVNYHAFKLPLLLIGKLLIVGVPGEPFGILSVMLREQLPAYQVIVFDEANGYAGYIPDKKSFNCGGYEANAAIFAETALELLVEKIVTAVEAHQ